MIIKLNKLTAGMCIFILDYVVFKLNKPPTNSLSLEYLKDLNSEFDRIEDNKNVNGVILTSVC